MKKVIAHLKSNALHYAMWAIFLALVITIGCNGTLSKYKSQYNGTGTGNVAKFEIITNGESKTISLSKPVPHTSYSFTIKSNSDVKVSYDIIITFEGEKLPKFVNLYLDDNIYPFVNENQYLFNDIGPIYAGDNGLKTHTLNFSLDVENYTPDNKISISDIQIQIIATQIL